VFLALHLRFQNIRRRGERSFTRESWPAVAAASLPRAPQVS